MTLFIIPVMYDILFKKQPLDVNIGSESLDDIPDDAAEYLAAQEAEDKEKEAERIKIAEEKAMGLDEDEDKTEEDEGSTEEVNVEN